VSDHPEFGLLDEYVLGTLERGDALRVAEHLKTCALCRHECDELRSVVDILPLALTPSPAPPALRERILTAVDVPRSRFSPVAIIRGLAAALLIALLGDVFLAIRPRPGHTVLAVATPATGATATATAAAAPAAAGATTTTGAATPQVSVTGGPAFVARAIGTARPVLRPVSAGSPVSTFSTRAGTSAPVGAAGAAHKASADDTETIARLKHELAVVRQQTQIDRRRIRVLKSEVARLNAVPRVVAAAPAPVAVTTPATVAVATPASTPSPPAAGETAGSGPPDAALVTALRSGKVYAIDGAVDGEPWHLTILQPREGERAVIYSGTPDAPSGQTYRTWVLRAGRTVNAGELVPGKPATLEMPMALEPGDVVAFSREPVGTGDLPTQPFLMQLKISQ
jgi:predicted anti-sigma-YlaC factor YlaD